MRVDTDGVGALPPDDACAKPSSALFPFVQRACRRGARGGRLLLMFYRMLDDTVDLRWHKISVIEYRRFPRGVQPGCRASHRAPRRRNVLPPAAASYLERQSSIKQRQRDARSVICHLPQKVERRR